MTVSKSQLKASQVYRKRNPERTAYTTLRRNAFNFVNGYQKGGKTEEAIKSDYGSEHYFDDLKDLQNDLKKAIERLK